MTDSRPMDQEERVESAFSHIAHPRKRAFLRRYATTGQKLASARDVGIHHDTLYSPAWRDDEEFQQALELARFMAGDLLEQEMVRRGVHGLRRVQFSPKTGEPLRDPHWCECGHHRDHHVKGAACADPDCACDSFRAEVYVEHEHSDRLLEQLARSHLPERYAKNRLEVNARLLRIDMARLPDDLLDRIAGGESVAAVLSSAAAAGEVLSGLLGRGSDGRGGEIVQDARELRGAGGRDTGGRGRGTRGEGGGPTDRPPPPGPRHHGGPMESTPSERTGRLHAI